MGKKRSFWHDKNAKSEIYEWKPSIYAIKKYRKGRTFDFRFEGFKLHDLKMQVIMPFRQLHYILKIAHCFFACSNQPTSHSCMHAIFNRNWVTFIPHVWCATVNNILSVQRRAPHGRNHHKNSNKTKEIIIIILKQQQQQQQQRRSNVDWRENLWNKPSNGVELNRKLIAV